MELFLDRTHLRLWIREYDAYLFAREDREAISVCLLQGTSPLVVWTVHRLVRGGTDYVLFHNAGTGRYLAQVEHGEHHVRTAQRAYDSPEQDTVLFRAVRAADGSGDITISNSRFGDMFHPHYMDTPMHWVVMAVPPRLFSLQLPPPPEVNPTELVAQMLAKLQPPQVVLRRMVHFVRSGDQGNFNHQWRIFEFEGQSVFNLRKNLANELGYILGITLCVRAGSSGRLTPLLIHLPSDENTMSIFVLTANSPAAQALLYNWRSHLQLPQVVLWLMINYVRADDQGNFNHQWRILEFEGQSVFNLRKNLAKELGYSDNILGITPCVRAGLSGRRTPLVIDLPFDENTMSIFVLTANSPAAQALAYNLRSHLQLLQVVLWLMIPYVRADDQGNFNHQWKILVFEGQSVFNLMRDLASKLGYSENILGITPFVQAGLSGRRTPLVIDLPCNDNTMDNLVLITDSPDFTRSVWAASTPVTYLSESRDMVVHSMHGLPSKVAQGDIARMQSFLTGIGDKYFIDCFNECLQPILNQVQHEKCYREFIGSPLEQTVESTCAIVSSAKCVEVQHRWEYETYYGLGTFPCQAAAPRKLRSLCRRKKVWSAVKGANVGKVLETIQSMGGIYTTKAPPPAPYQLPLLSWEQHPCSVLSADRVMELLDARGPFVGTLWVSPWYDLFDASENGNLVYRSGCARFTHLQEKSLERFGDEMVGLHSVVCFAYRVVGRDLHVLVLDNHTPTGPERWIDYSELEEIYTVSVRKLDPPLHLGRNIRYPRSYI